MSRNIGLYGKLPEYGGFVEHNLPMTFIRPWHDWLQEAITNSRKKLGVRWQESYRSAPVWRFALSPGCIDELAWLGIMITSLDRSGAFFPLTIAIPATASTHLTLAFHSNGDWFEYVEEMATQWFLSSSIETLIEALEGMDAPITPLWNIQPHHGQLAGQCLVLSPAANSNPVSSIAELDPRRPLDLSSMHSLNWNEALLRQQHSSYSLWCSSTGDEGGDVFLSCKGLPQAQGFTAMLSGEWRECGWNLVI